MADNVINNQTNNEDENKPSAWSVLKQVYKIKKQQKKAKREQEQIEWQKRKESKKQDKKILKQEIKQLKAQLKDNKKGYHKYVNDIKRKNLEKEEKNSQLNQANKQYNNNRVLIYDKIREIRFNFGKKYNTIWWRLTKWAYGIRKEFFRIIWSSPKNTFKYLGIITIIVLFLSLLFLLIDYLVTLM